MSLKFLGLRCCFAHRARDGESCSEMQCFLVIPQLESLKWGVSLEPSIDFMDPTLTGSFGGSGHVII